MERVKRAVCLLLCFVMVVGLLPMHAFAATTDDALTAALTEAKTYIDKLTVNNSSNDPSTVVSNYGKHFTWDNEKRESGKSYLWDWSYYNGVVFEGLEYLYEVTENETYKSYVLEYMSSLIASNGTWATCSNNSSKECAGYNSTHGADCYKTASLLLDAYAMSGDSRYLTMAGTLYKDLTNAANSYLLANAGKNFRHTWESDPNPDLWLDGLYMILPFRAEYAKYIGDQAELDLIVSRLQWVSDNMCDSTTKLFYHAADNATDNSRTYWLRSMGWYAAAIVDVMDSMEGTNLEAMKAQLVKLVDGLLPYQRESGLWSNAVTGTVDSDANREETSGTALLSYAIMKAVNNGWLNESYANYAIKAFKGICDNKLSGTTLKDICYIGTPGSSNAKFYDNEGKGVGPFIMLTAEVQEYVNKLNVPAPVLTGIKVVNNKEVYYVGDQLDITVYEVYSDGSTVKVESGYTYSGYNSSKLGAQTVFVTYGNYSTTVSVTVKEVSTEPELTSIQVVHTLAGKELQLQVTAVYDDGSTRELSADEYEVTGYNPNKTGAQAVVVTYENCSFAFNVYIDGETGISVLASGMNSLTISNVTETVSQIAAMAQKLFVAFDFVTDAAITAENQAVVSLPVPAEWEIGKLVVYYIDDNDQIAETIEDVTYVDGNAVFNAKHFSTYALANEPMPTAAGDVLEGSGAIATGVGTQVTSITSGTYYYLVNTKANKTLTGTSNGDRLEMNGTQELANANRWYITHVSGSTYYVQHGGPNGQYLTIGSDSAALTNTRTALTLAYNNTYNVRSWDIGFNGQYLNNYFGQGNYASGYNQGAGNDNGSRWALYPVTVQNVNFSIDPDSTTVASGQTLDLNAVVKVNNQNVNLSNCNITWSSSNGNASVSNGVVTGTGNGTATITATLSSVNGNALSSNIVLQVEVNVQGKSIDTDVDPVVTTKTVYTNVGQEPNFSGINVKVTYTDGDTGVLTVGSGLTVTGYDIENAGKYSCQLTGADGTVYGTFLVIVEIDFSDYEDATVYPEYPADGAVRIDKDTYDVHNFQESGVVRVELDVAGISVKKGVDVVLTVDISNSMAWETGSANSDNFTRNKLTEVMEAIDTFADIFLATEDGIPTQNTISIVFFAGKDTQHWAGDSTNKQIDAVLTACTKISNIDTIKEITSKTKFTGKDDKEYLLQIAYVNGSGNVATYSGQNRGDTNYDYAFWQTEQAVDQIIAANGTNSNREIHVLMMTDGCATNFNNVYYNSGSKGNYYQPGTRTTYTGTVNYKNQGGKAWVEWIQSSIEDNGGNVYAKRLKDKVNKIYAVGFDMAHGSFSGISNWDGAVKWDIVFNEVVQNCVQDESGNGMINVTNATDTEILNKFYHSLAQELRYAGTSAQVNDIIDTEFTLQMASTINYIDLETKEPDTYTLEKAPTISVLTYDLYSKHDAGVTQAQIGTRKGTSQEIEKVTFSPDGTQAYSSLKGENVNIMTRNPDGSILIDAEKFDYVKTADGKEYFDWNIGNITDKEIALAFDVYLKEALEGGAPAGAYYTNEEATLNYIDINGKHAHKVFPRPGVGWKDAVTTYEFYLANDKGEPINRNGDVIPFANRIIVGGPITEVVNKYLDINNFYAIDATEVLPQGYELLDEASYYRFKADVNEIALKVGGLGTVDVLDGKSDLYNTHVAFAVTTYPMVEKFILAEDVVVIDYGKKLPVDILANNNTADAIAAHDNYRAASIMGFAPYTAGFDPNTYFGTVQLNKHYTKDLTTTNGKYTVEKNQVRFDLSRFLSEVDKVLVLVKMVKVDNDQDVIYMYNPLTVIPATVMYYETDFADGIFTYTGSWDDEEKGPAADDLQDDGTIGKNQTYGYDSSYLDDAYLSNGTSKFVVGQTKDVLDKDNKRVGYEIVTTTQFSFTGTGFDLISRTGEKQGLIKVQVFSDASMTKVEKTVSVLNKSESQLEL